MSNTAPWTPGTIAHLRLLPLFDSTVFSFQQGARKPDPSIYLTCLRELNADPAASWFVSDKIYEDLWGAARVGMKTVFFDWVGARVHEAPGKTCKPDVVIHDLKDVLELPLPQKV